MDKITDLSIFTIPATTQDHRITGRLLVPFMDDKSIKFKVKDKVIDSNQISHPYSLFFRSVEEDSFQKAEKIIEDCREEVLVTTGARLGCFSKYLGNRIIVEMIGTFVFTKDSIYYYHHTKREVRAMFKKLEESLGLVRKDDN